jgi:hypothetical protein
MMVDVACPQRLIYIEVCIPSWHFPFSHLTLPPSQLPLSFRDRGSEIGCILQLSLDTSHCHKAVRAGRTVQDLDL